MPTGNAVTATGQRIDKWLWCARFFKSRALAAKACHDGRIRISGQVLTKAHHAVRIGDVLTFALGPHIRVVRVMALAARRGPSVEACALYEDLVQANHALPKSEAETRRAADAGRDGDNKALRVGEEE